jgi:virginiamycin B lyase
VGRALLGAALLLLALALAPGAGAHVYWGNYNSGTFGSANLDGTGVDQSFIMAAPGATPYGVAVDDAHVYWVNYTPNSIGRANLDGSGVDQSFIPTGTIAGDGVAVDAAHVYWANESAGTIGRANLDGTGVNQSFITGASGPSGPAVDGAHIYWANGNNGTIGRADLDGAGANQSFITGASQPLQVAVDAGHIYWANYNNANGTTIGRAELNGTDVNQSFIAGAIGPAGIGVDARHIYWANNGQDNGTTIGRANLDGTDVNQSFITGGNGPWYLAVAPLDTTITAAPSGTVADSSASFSFSGSEPGGFQCQLDGGGFTGCTSPMSYNGLAVGAHVFDVRADNGSGDIDPTPATAAWNVSAAAFGARTLVTLKLASGLIPAKGPITVRVTNANGFSINGKLSATTVSRVSVAGKRRVKLKTKAFHVRAHAKSAIKLNVPRALQRVLKRQHKLRLRLAATVRDPAGHARTVRKTVSLRLLKKRRS